MTPRLAALLLLSCGVARAELVCPTPEFVAPNEVRSGEPLRHRFEVRNAGTDAIEILGLKPGCGCLAPRIDRTRLAPGWSATVAVDVNTVTQAEGHNAWRVTVRYRQAGREAELALTLSATVRQVVTISPANLVVHTATGYTHVLTLTEKTPEPMTISAAVAGSPHVRATPGEPIRVGEVWRREIKLEVLPTCPEGRLEDVLCLTTPGRLDLRFPFAVVKRSAAVVRAAPPAVRLQSVGSQALPARIVLLSRGDDAPVAVERVEADHPAVATTRRSPSSASRPTTWPSPRRGSPGRTRARRYASSSIARRSARCRSGPSCGSTCAGRNPSRCRCSWTSDGRLSPLTRPRLGRIGPRSRHDRSSRGTLMAGKSKGRDLALTPGRRLVAELMHHARKVPSLPLARPCDVSALVMARRQAWPAVSWMAIFLKAYALAARDIPELRRAWIPFPYARLYEHPSSEAAVLIEREHGGESIVVGAKIRCPEDSPLAEIDAHLRRYRETPVPEVTAFRQLLRLAGLPLFLRRFFFWRVLAVSGHRRACRLGTFIISSLGNFGVEQMHPLTALTTYFTYGPISADGTVTLKVIYDHRVMDGRTVARILVRLEEVLQGAILDEVRGLARQAA